MPLAGFLPCYSSSLILLRQTPLLSKTLFKTISSPSRHRDAFLLFSSLRQKNKHLPSNPKTLKSLRPMTTTTTTNPRNPNPRHSNPNPDSRSRKKARRECPESVLRHKLGLCSRHNDLAEALSLYDSARADSVPLSLDHYNPLLYLCSQSQAPSSRGFEIFHQMLLDNVAPNEATFTSLARIAATDENPGLAFDLVKRMQAAGISPKLRSYGPALFGYCKKGEFLKAHEVEAHMEANGISPEEAELAALLSVNADKGRGDDVYRILQRMRELVRRVNEETAGAIEEWFQSEASELVGTEEWDEGRVREGVVKGGGGWHGTGWLGKGKWSVGRAEMDTDGVCQKCREKLVCIDIDPVETEDFARSLASLACQREARADFVGFQVGIAVNTRSFLTSSIL